MPRTLLVRALSIACLFVGVTFVVGDASSFAQAPPAKMVRGTIESINPDWTISMIEALSNDPWYVKLTFNDPRPMNNSKIAVTGTAEPAALTAGTWVEFKAELNPKTGAASGDLTQVSIYEPTDTTPPGAFLEGGPDAAAELGKKPTSPFLVRGQVKKATKTELQVFAPESTSSPARNIKIKLGAEMKIKVDLVDATIASKGDSISVDGKLLQAVEAVGKNKTPGVVSGDKVLITLAEPLGASKKRPTKKK